MYAMHIKNQQHINRQCKRSWYCYIYVTFVIISDNYSRASVRFFNYSRDEIFDNAN